MLDDLDVASMKTTVRLGLVGAGNVVQKMHLPILRSMWQVQVEWVCDQDVDRARSVAAAAGVPLGVGALDDCPDVDLVLVATPVGARRAVLEKVLPRGWHAFCEKPFASTLADHEWLVAEARRCGVRLGVGLVRRYYDSTSRARRMLETGLLGKVQLILAGEGKRVSRTGRGADWYQASAQASGGGVLFEHGSHLIDQVFTICGVHDYRIDRCSRQVVGDLEFETSVQGSFRLDEGGEPDFALVVTRLHDVYNGVVVRCKNGEVRIPPEPAGTVEIFGRDGMSAGRVGRPLTRAQAWHGALRAQWESFIAACARSSSFGDWDTGLLNTAFMEACARSHLVEAADTVR